MSRTPLVLVCKSDQFRLISRTATLDEPTSTIRPGNSSSLTLRVIWPFGTYGGIQVLACRRSAVMNIIFEVSEFVLTSEADRSRTSQSDLANLLARKALDGPSRLTDALADSACGRGEISSLTGGSDHFHQTPSSSSLDDSSGTQSYHGRLPVPRLHQ